MNQELNKLKQGVTADSALVLAICGIFILIFLSKAWTVIRYTFKDRAAFTVELSDAGTANGTQGYSLYVDGEELYPVDYNAYQRVDDKGETDYKFNVVLGEVKSILNCLIMEAVFFVLYQLLVRVRRGESPFVRRTVNSLRIIAVLSMALALLSPAVGLVACFIRFQYVFGFMSVTSVDFYVLAIGAVFGILSEIFKYGCALQDDMDQIA